jgi:branched-chain amino acid transport system permease protein
VAESSGKTRGNAHKIPVWIILIVCTGFLVLIFPRLASPFLLRLAILTLFWAYLGQCWNIMSGYAGQFSFGHAAYFGLGAYTSTLLLVNFGVNPWVGMILGGIVAMLGGLFIGFLCFRQKVRGVYFALATLAFAEILRLSATNAEFVRKSIGIQVPLRGGDSWLHFQFETTSVPYYYIICAMVLLSIAVVHVIERNKLGYYFKALHQNEEAAAALGVNLLRYKMAAMGISCFMTAAGGTFYAQYFFFIDPDLVFGAENSIEMLLRPIVGGVGTLLGPLVGALVLTPLSELTRTIIREPPGVIPFLSYLKGRVGVDIMLYGVIVIVVIIFMRHGLIGLISDIRRRRANQDDLF